MVRPKADSSVSAARLWSAAREHMAILFAAMDAGEVLLAERTLLALSGGPTADFNMCLVDDSPHLERSLVRAIDHARASALPTVFMVSRDAVVAVGDRTEGWGLTAAGEAPLMAFMGTPPAVDPAFDVLRVTDARDLEATVDLIAKAFSLDREWVGRTFASAALLENTSAVGFYLARRSGSAVSTVTVSGEGSVIGIWSMATDPDRQRRGAGRAALAAAMADRASGGARAFYLFATPAGKPLYDAVGFTTVEMVQMFVLGDTH